MVAFKGIRPAGITVLAPVACLAAFAAGLPFPVPAFLLPERVYVAPRAGFAPEALAGRSWARASLVLPGSLMPMPRNLPALAALAERFPARVDLDPVFAAAPGSVRPVRVVLDGQPSAADLARAAALHRESGIPVRFTVLPPRPSPLAAVSIRLEPGAASMQATVLLSGSAADADTVELALDGETVWNSAGADLPADRRVQVAVGAAGREGPARLELRTVTAGITSVASATLLPAREGGERVLMAGGEEGARSVIEALFPVRRVSPAELASADLYAYELVVLDGLPLSSLGADLAGRLADYVERGAGSILAVADSPGFGREGDAPALERILPVELSPRSVKNLPDLAMLIVIDVSGSMFGDKLSLAKVTGAETLGNLKPDDLVGMLLFSETAEWLYRFQPAGEVEPSALLSPLRAGGGTRLHPALLEGLDALESAPMPVKHLVVISDGVTEPADFDALIARARDAGVTVTAMAVGESFDRSLLTRLSSGTGGRLYRVLDAAEVPSLILEDRMSVSRTVFAEERVAIVGMDGSDAGSVGGMARFTAKPRSLVPFSSAAGDPLLVSGQLAGRSALVFATDLYGRHSSGFLEHPAGLAGFRATLAGLFHEEAPGATVTESADGIVVTVHSDGLLAPTLALADGRGVLVDEAAFASAVPGHWSATVSPAAEGGYTALVSDRGTVAARLPLYSNAGLSSWTDESAAALDAYRSPAFAMLPASPSWLLAFFLASLGTTLFLRTRR